MSCFGPCGFEDLLIDGIPASGIGAPPLFFSQVSTVTVTDAALNTIVSRSIPANTLASDGDHMVVRLWGDVLQSNAVAQTWSFGFSLNGVILWFDTSAAFAVSATRRTWEMDLDLERKTSTTVAFGGHVTFGNSVLLPINGEGDITTAPQGNAISSVLADPVVAWGSAQLFDFAVQASVVGIQFLLKGGFMEPKFAP